MDPDETLRIILAYEEHGQGSSDLAAHAAEDLADWLGSGGFKPRAALATRWTNAVSGKRLTPSALRTYADWLRSAESDPRRHNDDVSSDVPWTSFTYGVLPPKSLFMRNFNRIVGSDGAYHYHMKGVDAEVFDAIGVSAGPRSVDADELWGIVSVDLVWAATDGGMEDFPELAEAADDIIASILQTLNIEWI
jgi:hypothetical protein